MNEVIIFDEKEPRMYYEDVIKLMRCINKTVCCESFTLYKTIKFDCERNTKGWTYLIIADYDKFPIIITKKAAEDILKNPSKGSRLVFDLWHDRYR